ncbi:hypothetical protein BC829DRAFT_269339 [Chytridium lagenaria]|nr:hypothetical protein BC829DRAFT_269339 [Chytridium lagenaria]
MSPIHDFFQDVAVNELMDGLTELRYRAYESSQKRTLDYLRAVVGVWSVGCVCAMSSFFVIKASVNAIQATFSRTWELLSLVPDEVHSKIPDMGKFIADLTFETTSKRGALAIFFSYLVGKGSTQTVTPGAASSDPIVSTVPGSTESVPSTSGGLTDGIQRPLSGLALWIRKELYRDLYPDSMGEASKHRIYYMRRRLSAVRVGSLHAWALAVAVVITGEMSGWNISVARGGFGSLLVATVVGFINYSSVAFATAELQEENPTAVGSIVAYVRNNNLSPFLGYVGGNFLNFEYILFISLIISSISGYLWGCSIPLQACKSSTSLS